VPKCCSTMYYALPGARFLCVPYGLLVGISAKIRTG
jgi:hypothetical protein